MKVQRPGIGDTIALDMVLLRRLMSAIDANMPQLGRYQVSSCPGRWSCRAGQSLGCTEKIDVLCSQLFCWTWCCYGTSCLPCRQSTPAGPLPCGRLPGAGAVVLWVGCFGLCGWEMLTLGTDYLKPQSINDHKLLHGRPANYTLIYTAHMRSRLPGAAPMRSIIETQNCWSDCTKGGSQISQPLTPLVDEFAGRLFGELDYLAEGRSAERFQACPLPRCPQLAARPGELL